MLARTRLLFPQSRIANNWAGRRQLVAMGGGAFRFELVAALSNQGVLLHTHLLLDDVQCGIVSMGLQRVRITCFSLTSSHEESPHVGTSSPRPVIHINSPDCELKELRGIQKPPSLLYHLASFPTSPSRALWPKNGVFVASLQTFVIQQAVKKSLHSCSGIPASPTTSSS